MEIFFNAKKELARLEMMQLHCRLWYYKIQNTGNDLRNILELHRQMWKDGLHNPCFGPNKSGMFRTERIETMTEDEVYLGNVFGIWTNNIRFFEDIGIKFENGELSDTYLKICSQYRNHLLLNIKSMESKMFDEGFSRERICEQLAKDIAEITKSQPTDMQIINKRVQDNKVLTVTYRNQGRKVESDILILGRQIYYPVSINAGVKLNPKRTEETLMYSLGDCRHSRHILPAHRIRWDKDPLTLTRKDIRELRDNLRALNEKGTTYANL